MVDLRWLSVPRRYSQADIIGTRFRGTGIRIEDDVCFVGGQPRVLTSETPKTIAAIEQLTNTN